MYYVNYSHEFKSRLRRYALLLSNLVSLFEGNILSYNFS